MVCTAAEISVVSVFVKWLFVSIVVNQSLIYVQIDPLLTLCGGVNTCQFCCLYLSDFRYWLNSSGCTRYVPNNYILHGCLHAQHFSCSYVVWRLKFNHCCGITLNHTINEHTKLIRTSHLFWSDHCCVFTTHVVEPVSRITCVVVPFTLPLQHDVICACHCRNLNNSSGLSAPATIGTIHLLSEFRMQGVPKSKFF